MADNQSSDEELNTLAAMGDAGEEFPHKLRVHVLARLLGITSKQALVHLGDLGFVVRSAHSSIDRSAAERVRDVVRGAPAQRAATAPDQQAATAPDQQSSSPPVEQSVPARSDQNAPAAEPASANPQEDPAPVAPTPAVPSLFSALDIAQPVVVPVEPSSGPTVPLFLQPEQVVLPKQAPAPRVERPAVDDRAAAAQPATVDASPRAEQASAAEPSAAEQSVDEPTAVVHGAPSGSDDDESAARRRRRGRRGRGRGRGEDADDEKQRAEKGAPQTGGAGGGSRGDAVQDPAEQDRAEQDRADEVQGDDADGDTVEDVTDGNSRRRRRRRRRRSGAEVADSESEAIPVDDPPNTVVHEREPRPKVRRDEVRGISGSTRLEAKRQRRRDGRESVRRRPPILTESEFLARRESVDRVMVVRERTSVVGTVDAEGRTIDHPIDYTQVAVLEDGVLVEHFVTSSGSASMVGNIYLGRVQNVLPSMEAAFVDIGRGRNGVLYAGEVNWDAAGLDGNARRIEQALRPGDQVLVQVSKDPVGHKGARLTTQISLAGRFLVYVPGGGSAGISRKLPDTERRRLKDILKDIVPSDAGVIIRTASEGVSADELANDVARLQQQWSEIDAVAKGKGATVRALYEEPDLLVKVVRDLFNEDFSKLIVEGGHAWDTVERYVSTVAPDLLPRVERFEKAHADAPDVFVVHRIDEQLAKALDRKVWLPSGGTLVIDRTEAMTVIDVNTGKFTGSGGNLEETVTRNNLEAAEEIVRQMRLRDIGGMIVVDFIDMVLESNRDLVLRRLTESLGRDRTRHQVSEVTSLGLVQMTRKRIGTGLVEAFSTPCPTCGGRGILVHEDPVDVGGSDDSGRSQSPAQSEGGRKKRRRAGGKPDVVAPKEEKVAVAAVPAHKSPHPMFKAMAASHDPENSEDEVTGAEPTADAAVKVAVEHVAAAQQQPAAQEQPAAQQETTAARQEPAVREAAVQESAVQEAAPTVESAQAQATQAEAAQAEAASAEPAPAVRTAPQRRRRVARKAPTTTSAAAETIVVIVDAAPSAPVAQSVGATAAEPAVRRARRRAAARPAGPTAHPVGTVPSGGDGEPV